MEVFARIVPRLDVVAYHCLYVPDGCDVGAEYARVEPTDTPLEMDALVRFMRAPAYGAFVLHGVAGSGKRTRALYAARTADLMPVLHVHSRAGLERDLRTAARKLPPGPFVVLVTRAASLALAAEKEWPLGWLDDRARVVVALDDVPDMASPTSVLRERTGVWAACAWIPPLGYGSGVDCHGIDKRLWASEEAHRQSFRETVPAASVSTVITTRFADYAVRDYRPSGGSCVRVPEHLAKFVADAFAAHGLRFASEHEAKQAANFLENVSSTFARADTTLERVCEDVLHLTPREIKRVALFVATANGGPGDLRPELLAMALVNAHTGHEAYSHLVRTRGGDYAHPPPRVTPDVSHARRAAFDRNARPFMAVSHVGIVAAAARVREEDAVRDNNVVARKKRPGRRSEIN